jgi:protein TonB
MERDAHSATGFRLGIAGALAAHVAIFAITWPTVAQAPPTEPEVEYIPIRLVDLARPEPDEIPPPPIEIPPPPPKGPPVVDGPPIEVEVPPTISSTPPPVGPTVVIPPSFVEEGPVEPSPEPERTVVDAWVEIDPPTPVSRVEPRYTEAARRAGVQGVVILGLIIDPDGAVESITVHRGLPLGLTQNAVQAVEQWRFTPSVFHGRKVSVRYTLTVRFTLAGH